MFMLFARLFALCLLCGAASCSVASDVTFFNTIFLPIMRGEHGDYPGTLGMDCTESAVPSPAFVVACDAAGIVSIFASSPPASYFRGDVPPLSLLSSLTRFELRNLTHVGGSEEPLLLPAQLEKLALIEMPWLRANLPALLPSSLKELSIVNTAMSGELPHFPLTMTRLVYNNYYYYYFFFLKFYFTFHIKGFNIK